MTSTKKICHFCNTDYTEDHFIYLVNGPAHEASICEHCMRTGILITAHQGVEALDYHRCNMCGDTKSSIFYEKAPSICIDCLVTVEQLIELSKNKV